MPLHEDLASTVAQTFKSQWSVRNGTTVPIPERLALGNDAVQLEATVLYADLSDSTGLVDSYEPQFAAEVYKTYLHCAAKIIKERGGEITAYDGDRIMAVFLGERKNSSAAWAAFQINYARLHIIMPALTAQYPKATYELRHTIGIDTSSLFVAREGVRGANDLVWVGKAANHAAKLCSLSSDTPLWITGDVYARLRDDLKTTNGQSMWEKRRWTQMSDRTVYCSTWWWKV
ncbi:adenylate/guanylate cyclase domain-containing protein [Longimicrobium sp.]|uniref:adenylate/guanylate cyclase domain-containing protein n=1 Tax=Longimicrobium sp. TaxID=2029185 RepID=UPI002ED9D0DF